MALSTNVLMGKNFISLYSADVTYYFLKLIFHLIHSTSIPLKMYKLRNTCDNIRNPDSVFPITTLVKTECPNSLLYWGSWLLVKRALFEYLTLSILNYVVLLGGTTCQRRKHKRHEFNPWVRNIPWRRAWQPITDFLPGESHGQRSLVGYSPWGHKESDMTEVTYHCTLHFQRNRNSFKIL